MKSLPQQARSVWLRNVTTPLAPHGIVINPIRASTIGAMTDAVVELGKLTTDPPLAVLDTPSGRCLYLQDEEPFPAVLSGSTSPYTFQEVYSTPNGTWEIKPGGRTGQAYEVNGATGLSS